MLTTLITLAVRGKIIIGGQAAYRGTTLKSRWMDSSRAEWAQVALDGLNVVRTIDNASLSSERRSGTFRDGADDRCPKGNKRGGGFHGMCRDSDGQPICPEHLKADAILNIQRMKA